MTLNHRHVARYGGGCSSELDKAVFRELSQYFFGQKCPSTLPYRKIGPYAYVWSLAVTSTISLGYYTIVGTRPTTNSAKDDALIRWAVRVNIVPGGIRWYQLQHSCWRQLHAEFHEVDSLSRSLQFSVKHHQSCFFVLSLKKTYTGYMNMNSAWVTDSSSTDW